MERETNQENRCMKDESENWFIKSLGGEMEIQRSVTEGGLLESYLQGRALLDDDRLWGRL